MAFKHKSGLLSDTSEQGRKNFQQVSQASSSRRQGSVPQHREGVHEVSGKNRLGQFNYCRWGFISAEKNSIDDLLRGFHPGDFPHSEFPIPGTIEPHNIILLRQASVLSIKRCKQSRKVDTLYKNLRNDLRSDAIDREFARHSQNAVECLLEINDVIDEIGKVLTVLENQLKIWEELHKPRANMQDSGFSESSDKSGTHLLENPSRNSQKRGPHEVDAENDVASEGVQIRSATQTSAAPEGIKHKTSPEAPAPSKCDWDTSCDPSCFQEKSGVFAIAKKIETDAKQLHKKVWREIRDWRMNHIRI